jgi:ankyrin repeat protein
MGGRTEVLAGDGECALLGTAGSGVLIYTTTNQNNPRKIRDFDAGHRLKLASSGSRGVFDLLNNTITGLKQHGAKERTGEMGTLAKEGRHGLDERSMGDDAQKQVDSFPAWIDAIVSALENAKLVDLDGRGCPDDLGQIPAIVEQCAKEAASKKEMADSIRKRYRDAERNHQALEEKYYDLVADQARRVAIELYTAAWIGGVDVSFLSTNMNRRLRDVASMAALTEEALEAAAEEKLQELFPYFQLLRDGLRSMPGFASRDIQARSGKTAELVRGQILSLEALEVYRHNIGNFVSMPAFASFSEEEEVSRGFISQAPTGELVRVLFHLQAKDRRQIGGRSLFATEREVLMEAFSAFRVTKVDVVAEPEVVEDGRVVFEAGPVAHIWLNDPHVELERPRASETNELHRAADAANLSVIRQFAGRFDWLDSVDEDGRTPLHRVFRPLDGSSVTPEQKARAAAALIAAGSGVDRRCRKGRTPLYQAAFACDLSSAVALIDAKAVVDATNSDGSTPLFAAAQEGREALTKLLLDRGADVNQARIDSGATPLYVASQQGQEVVVKLLLDRGADANKARSDGRTPLYTASGKGHEGVAKLLLERGADVNKARSDTGATPLYVAAQEGHETVVKLLLDRGADVNKATTDGRTPLFMASGKGHDRVVKLLLERGADVNSARSDCGATPLYIASHEGRVVVVKLLLERGADVNAAGNDAATPLYVALQQGHGTVAKLLLQRGADVNKATTDGRTPLLIASGNGHQWVAKLLLERGADVNKATTDGRTPLYIASQEGHEAVAKLLLQRGADVNKATTDGRTPLFVASGNGHQGVAKLLLERRADVDKATTDGRTPLYIALQEAHEAVVTLLFDRGADAVKASIRCSMPASTEAQKGHAGDVALTKKGPGDQDSG